MNPGKLWDKYNGKSNFVVHGNSGVQMTFANGYTISIQWKPSSYSQHHDFNQTKNILMSKWWKQPSTKKHLEEGWSSDSAEVAVGDANNKWYHPHTLKLDDPQGDVAGWQSTDDVATIISKVQSIKV